MIAHKSSRPIESIEDNEYHAIVIHGEDIDSLSDDDWGNIFSKQGIILLILLLDINLKLSNKHNPWVIFWR